ncbi:DgyrCDS13319 [Dimorphilus gyrociliatus]|uniref:DgyrCDS13319 n=1 Tax=Dimorphilus gyrociliatus TaxID=2664684 RepID=A0A7I8WAB5_9ANNE|nr:DgyrCDS13319 [Dimorphilus gyrociliatus]
MSLNLEANKKYTHFSVPINESLPLSIKVKAVVEKKEEVVENVVSIEKYVHEKDILIGQLNVEKERQRELEIQIERLKSEQESQRLQIELKRQEAEKHYEEQELNMRNQLKMLQEQQEIERKRILEEQLIQQEHLRHQLERQIKIQEELKVTSGESVQKYAEEQVKILLEQRDAGKKKEKVTVEHSTNTDFQIPEVVTKETIIIDHSTHEKEVEKKKETITVEHSTNTDFPEIVTKETIVIDNNQQLSEIEKLWKEKFDMQLRQHERFIEDQQQIHLKQREVLEMQLSGEREKQFNLERELDDLKFQQEQQRSAFEREREEQLKMQEYQSQQMQEQLLLIKLEQEQKQTAETHIIHEKWILEQKEQLDEIEKIWKEKFEIQQQQQLKYSQEQQALHFKQQQLLAEQLEEEREKQHRLEIELSEMKAAQDQQLLIFEQQREQQIKIQEMQQIQMQEQIKLLQEQQEAERIRMIEEQQIQKTILERELEQKLMMKTQEKEIITKQQITQQQILQESLLEEHRRQMEEMERLWREKFDQQRLEQERLSRDQELAYERQKQLLEQQLEEERRKQISVEEQMLQMKKIQEQQHYDFEQQRLEQNKTREFQQNQWKEQLRLLQEQKETERIQILKDQLQQQNDLKDQLKKELNQQQIEKELVMQQQLEQQRLLQEQYDQQKLLQEQMMEEQRRKAEEAERVWREKMALQQQQQQQQQKLIDIKKSEIKEIRTRQMVPSINGNAPYNFVTEEDATRKLVLSSLERKAHVHSQINYDSGKSGTPEPVRTPFIPVTTSPPNTQPSGQALSPVSTGFYTPPPPATDIIPEVAFRPPMSYSKQEEEVVIRNDVINEYEGSRGSSPVTDMDFETKNQFSSSSSSSSSFVDLNSTSPAAALLQTSAKAEQSVSVTKTITSTAVVKKSDESIQKTEQTRKLEAKSSLVIPTSEVDGTTSTANEDRKNMVVAIPQPPPVLPAVKEIKPASVLKNTDESFQKAIEKQKKKLEEKSMEAKATSQVSSTKTTSVLKRSEESSVTTAKVQDSVSSQKLISDALHDRFQEAVPGYRKDYIGSSTSSLNTERPKSELPDIKPVVGDPHIKLDEDEDDDEETIADYIPEDDGWKDGVTRVIHIQDKYTHVLIKVRVEKATAKNNPMLIEFLFKVAQFTLHQFKKRKIEKLNFTESALNALKVEPDNFPLSDHFEQLGNKINSKVAIRGAVCRRFTGQSHVGGEIDGTIKSELKCTIGTSGVLVVLHKTNRLAPAAEFCQQICEHILKLKPKTLGVQKSISRIEPAGCLLAQKFLRDNTINIADAARRCMVQIAEFVFWA